MAQLVARLVRNEKVGGSNPPSSTTGRHPIRMSVFFVCLGVGVVPVVVLLGAPLVFGAPAGPGCGAGPLCVPVGGGPPARSPHASLTARSGRSRGPPWPCRRPPAPRPGPEARPCPPGPPAPSTPAALVLLGLVRPGPAAAHGHRGLASPARTGTAASPAYNAIPAAASTRSYVGVDPLFRAADHVEASSHDVRHRGSAPGLAANRRAMTAPLNA